MHLISDHVDQSLTSLSLRVAAREPRDPGRAARSRQEGVRRVLRDGEGANVQGLQASSVAERAGGQRRD